MLVKVSGKSQLPRMPSLGGLIVAHVKSLVHVHVVCPTPETCEHKIIHEMFKISGNQRVQPSG